MNIGLIPQKWARLTPQKEAVIDAEKNRRITFSELEDLDYAQAVTELNLRSVALQAAQQSYVKIQGLSLFNYLR